MLVSTHTALRNKIGYDKNIELCKKYASEEDKSFVNGVLSSVSKEEK